MWSTVSKNSLPNRQTVSAVLAIVGVAYPFLVYAGSGSLPPGAWAVLGLALASGRMLAVRGEKLARHLLPPLCFVVAAMAGTGAMAPELATRLYPVLMSLAFASAFGLSLMRPPSLIEVFAALGKSAPPPTARPYMRRLTAVWCIFLLANSGAAAATLGAPEWLWALYNGLISYLLIGALFLGERLLRKRLGG